MCGEQALAYTTRPLRIIVPYAPGGGTDFAARVIGEYLSRGIGQQAIKPQIHDTYECLELFGGSLAAPSGEHHHCQIE